jgi:hypothetical protein
MKGISSLKIAARKFLRILDRDHFVDREILKGNSEMKIILLIS